MYATVTECRLSSARIQSLRQSSKLVTVERLAKMPCCCPLSSLWRCRYCITCLLVTRSISLQNTEGSEASPFLYVGVTMALFHVAGTWPTDKNELNNSDNGVIREGAIFLSKMGGKPSGPADALLFMWLISRRTLPSVQSTLSRKTSSVTSGWTGGKIPSSRVPIYTKYSFRSSALALSDNAAEPLAVLRLRHH